MYSTGFGTIRRDRSVSRPSMERDPPRAAPGLEAGCRSGCAGASGFLRGQAAPLVWRAERGDIELALRVFQDHDHRIAQGDFFHLDLPRSSSSSFTPTSSDEPEARPRAECRIILNDKPADPGADARPDRQANVLELDLSVQGLNRGAVPVLVPVQVDQKWERDDQDQGARSRRRPRPTLSSDTSPEMVPQYRNAREMGQWSPVRLHGSV